MVFNATFNNISVLLVENTGVNQTCGKFVSHNVASSTPRQSGIRTHNVSGDGD